MLCSKIHDKNREKVGKKRTWIPSALMAKAIWRLLSSVRSRKVSASLSVLFLPPTTHSGVSSGFATQRCVRTQGRNGARPSKHPRQDVSDLRARVLQTPRARTVGWRCGVGKDMHAVAVMLLEDPYHVDPCIQTLSSSHRTLVIVASHTRSWLSSSLNITSRKRSRAAGLFGLQKIWAGGLRSCLFGCSTHMLPRAIGSIRGTSI